jgi:hypothetical protein
MTTVFVTIILCESCGNTRQAAPDKGVALRPSTYNTEFQREWEDGAAEVSSYQTERLRDGTLLKGAASMVLRRAQYSEDERVPVEEGKRALPGDLFPAIQMNWIESYTEGLAHCSEMSTSAVAMISVDGRVAGAETKADFSFQGWDGPLFHQLIFDATDIRSHQYSYFQSEGDEQIALSYPRDGVAGDALWLWARHMAAPALNPGEWRAVEMIPALREARERHRSLTWRRATLARSSETKIFPGKTFSGQPADIFSVRWEDGGSETFVVEKALPYRVVHWESSTGESADFLSSSRVGRAAWPVLFAPAAKSEITHANP